MTVRVKGLDEFRRELRKVDKNFGKAFGIANKAVGEKVVSAGKPAVKNLSSPGGSVAGAGLKSSAKQTKAVIRLLGSNPTLHASVFGTKSHMVFGRRISGSGPWQPWIGNSWQPEELYGLGPAITSVMDGFALDEYMEAVLDAVQPAFPN